MILTVCVMVEMPGVVERDGGLGPTQEGRCGWRLGREAGLVGDLLFDAAAGIPTSSFPLPDGSSGVWLDQAKSAVDVILRIDKGE